MDHHNKIVRCRNSIYSFHLQKNTLKWVAHGEGPNIDFPSISNVAFFAVSQTGTMVFVSASDGNIVKWITPEKDQGSFICRSEVIGLAANKRCIVVACKSSIEVIDFVGEEVFLVSNVAPMPGGPLILSDGLKTRVGFLQRHEERNVFHFKAFDETEVACFKAHQDEIVSMQINNDGNRIATASSHGTLIRVFAVPCGCLEFEIHLSFLSGTLVSSLSFSPDGLFLAVAANSSTVYIFSLTSLQISRKCSLTLKKEKSLDKENLITSTWSALGWIGKTTVSSIYSAGSTLLELSGIIKRNRNSFDQLGRKDSNMILSSDSPLAKRHAFAFARTVPSSTPEEDDLKQTIIWRSGVKYYLACLIGSKSVYKFSFSAAIGGQASLDGVTNLMEVLPPL